MALELKLDRDDALPLYQQIVEQVKERVSDGRLPPGTRMPTIRALSAALGVTRLTVHTAYNELQAGGWIESTVGRGTFVSRGVNPPSVLAAMGQRLTPDGVMNDLALASNLVGLRALAGAYPDPATFPSDELWRAFAAQRAGAASLLSYTTPSGDPQLRLALSSLLHDEGIEVTPDEVLVTSGVTQGLSLVAQALAHPGETVLVEQPTYLGFLNVLNAQGLQPIGIPLDEDGPRLDALEQAIKRYRPRFYYTIPTYHNPTGMCMTLERRRALLELARQYDLLLVEDDLYRPLAYDENPPSSLKQLDRHNRVVYLNGFSKILAPGLRVGYIVAPRGLHDRLRTLRLAADLGGPPLLQRALATLLEAGWLRHHLRDLIPLYRERRDAFLEAMTMEMPSEVQWTRPAGGFCCWVTLPAGYAFEDLHQRALRAGISYTPGEVFLPQATSHRHLRLCFGSETPASLRSAVATLASLIEEGMAVTGRRPTAPVAWAPLV